MEHDPIMNLKMCFQVCIYMYLSFDKNLNQKAVKIYWESNLYRSWLVKKCSSAGQDKWFSTCQAVVEMQSSNSLFSAFLNLQLFWTWSVLIQETNQLDKLSSKGLHLFMVANKKI